MQSYPHRRLNPLTGEWILVSPHRTRRPWQGHVDEVRESPGRNYDPDCYLCPGNERAGHKRNPRYSSTFVFDNDFAALLPDDQELSPADSGLLVARPERGVCRVVCFSPQHDLTLARMTLEEIRPVVDTWVAQWEALASIPWVQYVQIFENRGDMMGASNPHPHCQIWASESLPNEPEKETRRLYEHLDSRERCLLCEYLAAEVQAGERVVCENDGFVALTPFWALWPFETLILSRRHMGGLTEFGPAEKDNLARILKQVTVRYDNLFRCEFPYSMGLHQQPTDGHAHPEWHFHIHFYPPLLRSATVRKFMVGYEMLATPQRDITPEAAAQKLRELPERHYTSLG